MTTTYFFNYLCKAEPLHVLGAVHRDRVSNVSGIDTLNSSKGVRGADSPGISLVVLKREVLLRLLRLGSIVAENAGPLLDGLLVVLRAESRVDAAVVDLEARAGAGVAGVHVLDGVGPVLSGGLDLALSAGGVPGSGLVGGGDLGRRRNKVSELVFEQGAWLWGQYLRSSRREHRSKR